MESSKLLTNQIKPRPLDKNGSYTRFGYSSELKIIMVVKNTVQKNILVRILIFYGIAEAAWADEEGLSSYFDMQTIGIVSGYEQNILDAPAMATVISRDEIDKYGFLTLGDVLRWVPGLHISPSADAVATVTTSRGTTNRILIMYDGVEVPFGSVNSHGSMDNLPLFDIESIEIMRGPNSALYGPDAVLGVINMLSSSKTINRSRVGLSMGSQGRIGVNGTWVGSLAGKRIAIHASQYESDGSDNIIDIDRQSLLDAQLGTQVSRAPGSVDERKTLKEAKIFYSLTDNIDVRAHYYEQSDLGYGVGPFQALVNGTSITFKSSNILASYRGVVGEWAITGDLSYFRNKGAGGGDILPPGTLGGLFPAGVIQTIANKENRVKLQVLGVREIGDHRFRVGASVLDSDQVSLADTRNFTFLGGATFPIPLGEDIDFARTDMALFQNLDYQLRSVFGSDEWKLSNDWTAIVGIRVDDYSNVGTSVNPRASMVWNYGLNGSIKLSYGKAFRPPSSTQLSSNGFFIALGNRDLEPTTVQASEVIFQNKWNNTFSTRVSFYDFSQKDIVQTTPDASSPNGFSFTNGPTVRGRGVELESEVFVSDRLVLRPSVAFSDVSEDIGSPRSRYNPRYSAKLDVAWEIADETSLFALLRYVGKRERGSVDPRPNPDDYTLVDVTLSKQNIFDGLSGAISVKNVFDEDAREPISNAIVNDYPFAERTLMLNVTKEF